jgi:[protein-PII] uridylyltransferase
MILGEPSKIADAIAAACERERAGQAHGAIGAALKMIADQRRRASIADYARGEVAAERYSQAIDEAIAALFAEGAKLRPDAAKKLSLAAVGGYGRGLLAPYSDVDLLFVLGAPEAQIRPLLDYILYPLWDAGLKIGHAAHTPASAIAQSKDDLVSRTAYLDARLLAGAPGPLADFQRRLTGMRLTTKKSYRKAKLDELDGRHMRLAQAAYLAEPDLKEGRGGLRDLHTIAWIHKYEFDRDLSDERGRRIFGAEDAKAFKRCERFLWSVRVQLHGLRGRADDALTFDIQPQLAEKLGYAERGGMSAGERLMKDYFVNALEVGRLVRLFRAGLDDMDARLSPKAFRVIPKTLLTDEAGGKANLKLSAGRLAFEDARRARRTPTDLFRLFRALGRRPDLDIHPDALSLVAQASSSVGPEARKDPALAVLFLATLTGSKDPSAPLRLMAETGLLGRYIPAFGKIIGRIEYGLYRRYSVDESVFQSIAVLAEIERGEARERHPIASRILKNGDGREEFYLATLLHEIGWSLRDPAPDAVEKLVETIVTRLGLAEEQTARIAWCAARPLHLVRHAERRNLAEPAAVRRFAEDVGEQRRLDLLLVLAVCHLRVVGLSSWDEWRRGQITELYEAATDYLSGGEASLSRRRQERASAARLAVGALLGGWSGGELDATLSGFPDDMFGAFEAEVIARVADLARSAAREGEAAAVTLQPREGALEAIVYADDRTGLLADLAGAVASAGVSVRSVHAMTTASGKAIDVFFLQSVEGGAIADQEQVRRLHARLLAAARARPAERPAPLRRIGDRRAMFQIAPKVAADLDASDRYLVIDAEGRDRPGLLYDLTSALAEMDVAIQSAHVATYGARAVDAFYLEEADGGRISSRHRIQAIERRLEAVLASGEPPRSSLSVKA